MRPNRTKHHGLALMVVLVVVALASLIGLAMLSSASLQAQVAGANERSASADYLAESAVQLAAYYLQYPSGIPAGWTNNTANATFAAGATVLAASGQSLSNVSGTFDVTVTAPTASAGNPAKLYVYDIHAVGHSIGEYPLSRTIDARVELVPATPTFACGFGGNTTIPAKATVNGAIVASGTVTNNGAVTGVIRQSTTAQDFVVPTAGSTGTIYYFGGDVSGTYRMPDGTADGTTQTIGDLAVAPSAVGTNPGAIFYCPTNLNITASMTITGTLVVRGNLVIKPPIGGTVTINPKPGFPAIIVDSALQVGRSSVTVNVNGVSFLGNGQSWTLPANTNSVVNFGSPVLMPSGKVFQSSAQGAVVVTYPTSNLSLVSLTNITKTRQPILNVRLKSWKQ